MNQPQRTLPTESDWVDVEAGTAARAIFTAPAIWQLEQERIFAKSRRFQARASESPQAGDYNAGELSNHSV